MKKLVLISTFILSGSLMAAPVLPLSQQLGDLEITEISNEDFKSLNGFGGNNLNTPNNINNINDLGGNLNGGFTGETPVQPTTLERTGKVIQTARDIVALGEAIYELVKKGKPTNVTEYAPISVVPKDPATKEHVDPFELEGFSIPVQKSFTAKIKNGFGKEVVSFTYSVIYSYGGSFNGAGKYLTGVSIIPGAIRTTHGWEFNASMKLSGIMNHGTRLDPVAGVLVTIKYQMNSMKTAFERNDTIHLSGLGQLTSYGIQ